MNETHRWVIGATLTMAVALGIGRFAYTPLLPQMVAEFGWTFGDAGDVAAANFLGYMVGAMVAARIAYSPLVRMWVAASLMASVATTYLGAEITGFVPWLGLRFLAGVASAFCLVVVTTLLVAELARTRDEHMGNVHFAGVGVGILVCMGAVALGGTTEIQWARLGAVSAVLMVFGWMLLSRHIPTLAAPSQDEQPGRLNGRMLRLIVGYGFFGYGYIVAATFVVAMAEQLGEDPAAARSVWIYVGVAIPPSVYLWQYLANRIGTLPALRAAYVVEAIGLACAAFSQSYGVLALSCVLLGGTFAAITALGLSAAREESRGRVGGAIGLMTSVFAVGQLVGPAVSGRMADWFGDFFWASLLAAALLGMAAIIAPSARREGEVSVGGEG